MGCGTIWPHGFLSRLRGRGTTRKLGGGGVRQTRLSAYTLTCTTASIANGELFGSDARPKAMRAWAPRAEPEHFDNVLARREREAGAGYLVWLGTVRGAPPSTGSAGPPPPQAGEDRLWRDFALIIPCEAGRW